jgi:hypothetical protein
MAERDQLVSQASDATGVFQVIAVVEDTQSTTDPRGRSSPTVVRVRLVNTSTRRGSCRWQAPNGAWSDVAVLPGENAETNVSPPRREFLYLWGEAMNADWGA